MKMKLWLIAAITILLTAIGACSSPQPETALNLKIPIAQPKVVSFIADPSKVENGSIVKLYWEVINADSVVIDNGIGEVPLKGSLEVRPYQLTAYNLTAKNTGASVASAVIVNVRPFIKVASEVASPQDSGSLPANALPWLGANESYVFFQGAVMVGADEHFIVLHNNPEAHNPTWDELKSFLRKDQTERYAYIAGKFTCGDFAETLHNNAEAAGIRAAIVAIELQPANMGEDVVNHSLNAFETTDRGIMYIDDTSSSQGFFADKEANVVVGQEYVCVSIFPQPGQMQTWPSMGKIQAIDIFQW